MSVQLFLEGGWYAPDDFIAQILHALEFAYGPHAEKQAVLEELYAQLEQAINAAAEWP